MMYTQTFVLTRKDGDQSSSLYQGVHPDDDIMETARRAKEISDEEGYSFVMNGIQARLLWIAQEYTHNTPISLHEWGTKIPELSLATWPGMLPS